MGRKVNKCISRQSNPCEDAYLNQVLALGLGDQWLKLGSGEGVDQTSLRDDQQEHLSAGEDGQFIGLA